MDLNEIEFTIRGDPPRATAQQRRFSVHGGHIHTYMPERVKAVQAAYAEAIRPYAPPEPLTGPLEAEVEYIFETGDRKKIGTYKTTRPDLDNSGKILWDACTRCGIYEDDSQLVKVLTTKKWGAKGEGRTTVKIKKVGEVGEQQ